MHKQVAILAAGFLYVQAACLTEAERRREAEHDLASVLLLLRIRDEPYVMRQLRAADEATDAASKQLGPPLQAADRYLVDVRLSRPERLGKALTLLASARQKLAGTDSAAVRHIDEALDALRRASEALGSGLLSTPQPGDQRR